MASTPTPMPVMTRPMNNWGNSNEVHEIASPIKVKIAPTNMVFRRPSTSPMKKQDEEPKNAPRVNEETYTPWMTDRWDFKSPVTCVVSS